MKEKEKSEGVLLNKGLIDALEGMKLSKDRSAMISGGADSTSPVIGKDLAWICIGDGCNPACNTSCTNCVAASCTTNYG